MAGKSSVQQLERSSEIEPSGGLSGGAGRPNSPSKYDPPLAVNAAGRGDREPSRGAEGGSTVTGSGKNNIHRETDGVQLQKKLEDKEREIRQLMDTMTFLTKSMSNHNNLVAELKHMKKENEELNKRNVNLELANRLMRSNLDRSDWPEDVGQASKDVDQQLDEAGFLEGTGWSDQGSLVTNPEDEHCHSSDSYVLLAEPMNIEKVRPEDKSDHYDDISPSLLQEQIKEHEESFRKERNDRVLLNEKYKRMVRALKVLTAEKNQALHRAAQAEAEASKTKEELYKLQERLERMASAPEAESAHSSGTPSTSASSRKGTDSNLPRDPLACVWPQNNYRLIMPPGYSHRDPASQAGSSGAAVNSEAAPQGKGAEAGAGKIKYLDWDMGGAMTKEERWDMRGVVTKREWKSGRVTSSPERDDIEDIKRAMKKKSDDENRWKCQVCTYRNRARRSECDCCGTVDAVQRRRHTHCT